MDVRRFGFQSWDDGTRLYRASRGPAILPHPLFAWSHVGGTGGTGANQPNPTLLLTPSLPLALPFSLSLYFSLLCFSSLVRFSFSISLPLSFFILSFSFSFACTSTSQLTAYTTHSERPHPHPSPLATPKATRCNLLNRCTHTSTLSMSSALSSAVPNLGQSHALACLYLLSAENLLPFYT